MPIPMIPDYMGRTAKSIAFIFCPAWGMAKATALRATCFQFTLLCGGRHEGQIIKQYNNLFQFTPPRGGRRVLRSFHRHAGEFQFTPPRGGGGDSQSG